MKYGEAKKPMMPPRIAPKRMQSRLPMVMRTTPISILRISVPTYIVNTGLARSSSAPPAIAKNSVIKKRKTRSSIHSPP